MIRYALAAVSVGVVMMLTVWLREAFRATPNALFFCAIILSGWFGGFGPGLVASILSILAIKYYSTPPTHDLDFTIGEVPRFGVFLMAGVFISWLGDRQRRDERALLRARDFGPRDGKRANAWGGQTPHIDLGNDQNPQARLVRTGRIVRAVLEIPCRSRTRR
ncbi:MAG: DUF4118 domain-containing protein [Chthoniobacter sp.]|nr:DUF4118 domain-containing protein [Chthoniobacter sp.]